jgi:hypothetical protein
MVSFGGTAASGIDYEVIQGLVTFAAGQDRVIVSSAPIDDTVHEGDETVEARLMPWDISAANQYRIDPSNAVATVILQDNDPPGSPPVVSLELVDGSATETLSGQNFADWTEFRVARSGTVSNAVDVFLNFQGTARLGEDYELDRVSDGRTVRIPAGLASVNVRLWVTDDAFYEGEETVSVNVVPLPPMGIPHYDVDPAHSSVAMTIRDNESPTAPLVSIRATVPETREPLCDPNICDAPTPAPGVFVVSRSGGDVNEELTVFLRYTGTATSGSDCGTLPDSIVFHAGTSRVELRVDASYDTVAEGDETVVAELSPDPTLPMEDYRVDPVQASARVVIHDRTPPNITLVTVVATDPFAREGGGSNTSPNPASFEVRRVGETNSDLTVMLEIRGTAANGVDYVTIPGHVTIPAGSRSTRIIVTPSDDDLRERIETVIVEVLHPPVPPGIPEVPPAYLAGGPRRAAAIIVDNDLPRPPCASLPEGLFNVCLPASSNDCFRLESTRDFKEWTPLCVAPIDEGVAHYVDPDASDLPQRFYRLVPVACETVE